MDAYEFDTPKTFPKPSDVKKDGDTHRFLADLECTGTDDDGTMHWKLLALDGVKMPEDKDESDDDEGAMDEYDSSQDETDEGESPKDTKALAASLLAPPAQ